MAGPAEEAGQTARSLIDALKGNPVLLGSMVLNFGFLVFIFYALHSSGKFRETLINQVLTNSQRIHELVQQRGVTCPDGKRSEIEVEPLKPLDLVEEPHKPISLEPSLAPQAQPLPQ